MLWPDRDMLAATWALVVVTAVLVIVTIRLGNKQLGVAIGSANQQNEALKAELKARLQLQFADRFDSQRIVEARKELQRAALSAQRAS